MRRKTREKTRHVSNSWNDSARRRYFIVNRRILTVFGLIFCFTFLSACESGRKKEEVQLTLEFTLESAELAGAVKMEEVFFAKEVTKTKVTGIGPDKKGVELGYVLEQDDTEKLITLMQEGEITGVPATRSDFSSISKRDSYGLMLEFVDSLDRFYEGVARISCFTTADENYMSIINADGDTELYKITLPEEVISYLNEKSLEQYQAAGKGRNGWFDKAFN